MAADASWPDVGRYMMRRCLRGDDGVWSVGSEIDIVDYFPGLRYKSLSGMDAVGERRVYAEEWAEADGVGDVYVPSDSVGEQSELTLTLYFFNDADYYAVDATARANIGAVYHRFVDYVTGCVVLFIDKIRNRKVLMYLEDSFKPTTDSLKGAMYVECGFKFKNMHSRTFELGVASPIEAELLGVDVSEVMSSQVY